MSMSSSSAWDRGARRRPAPSPRRGESGAGALAEVGLSVAGVESLGVGVECPEWGCDPSKMRIGAGTLLAEGRRIPGMAGGAEVHADWAPVARRIRDEATDNWDDTVAADR